MRPCRAAGFTLIEVMVALVIVALGMMAVNTQLNRYTVAAIYVEQKTLASWIATNKLTELSIAPTWPSVGDYDEDIEFAGQQWRCDIVVEETPVSNLHRVDVSVSLLTDPERVVHKVSALIEPPAPEGFLPPQWSAVPSGGSGDERGGGRGRFGGGAGGEPDGAENGPEREPGGERG
jgi:general secretion pathway protein I